MKKNYTQLFPSYTVDVGPKVNREEEGVETAGDGADREEGRRNGASVEVDKKKLMKKQGFVNYTEGEFFERLVESMCVCVFVRIVSMYVFIWDLSIINRDHFGSRDFVKLKCLVYWVSWGQGSTIKFIKLKYLVYWFPLFWGQGSTIKLHLHTVALTKVFVKLSSITSTCS